MYTLDSFLSCIPPHTPPPAETGIYKSAQINFCKGAPWRVPWLKCDMSLFQYNGWPNIPVEKPKLIKYSVPFFPPPPRLTHTSLESHSVWGFFTEDVGKLLRVLRLNFLCVWLHDSISMCFDPCVKGAGSARIAVSRWCYREQTVVF